MRIFKNSISLLGVKALRTTGALHQDHVHPINTQHEMKMKVSMQIISTLNVNAMLSGYYA